MTNGLAEHPFGGTESVRLGSVEEADPEIDRVPDRGFGLAGVDRTPSPPSCHVPNAIRETSNSDLPKVIVCMPLPSPVLVWARQPVLPPMDITTVCK
jgi:hypothetical protein